MKQNAALSVLTATLMITASTAFAQTDAVSSATYLKKQQRAEAKKTFHENMMKKREEERIKDFEKKLAELKERLAKNSKLTLAEKTEMIEKFEREHLKQKNN